MQAASVEFSESLARAAVSRQGSKRSFQVRRPQSGVAWQQESFPSLVSSISLFGTSKSGDRFNKEINFRRPGNLQFRLRFFDSGQSLGLLATSRIFFFRSLAEALARCTGYRPILDAAKAFACDKDKCPSASEEWLSCREKSMAQRARHLCGFRGISCGGYACLSAFCVQIQGLVLKKHANLFPFGGKYRFSGFTQWSSHELLINPHVGISQTTVKRRIYCRMSCSWLNMRVPY